MTIFVSHRINSIKNLHNIHSDFGVEIDLRDYNNDIILAHDPFLKGDLFEDFLKAFKHSFLILNIKSEGIEFKILELLKKYHISNYFFLDCSFPVINKLINIKENKIAIRYSEYESLETILNFKNKVEWIWIDNFNFDKFNLDKDTFNILKKRLEYQDYQRYKYLEFHLARRISNFAKYDLRLNTNRQYNTRHQLHYVEKMRNNQRLYICEIL